MELTDEKLDELWDALQDRQHRRRIEESRVVTTARLAAIDAKEVADAAEYDYKVKWGFGY